MLKAMMTTQRTTTLTTIATARWAMNSTTAASVRQDTTTTTMAMDVDVDDQDDETTTQARL